MSETITVGLGDRAYDIHAGSGLLRLVTKVDSKSRLITNKADYYKVIGTEFAKHETVTHSNEERVRGTY